MKLRRDSYSRVTDENGKFTYPKIAENIERIKGEMYWTNKTLCGTTNVSSTQYSLINAYNDYIFPNMEKFQAEKVKVDYTMWFFSNKKIEQGSTIQLNTILTKIRNLVKEIG